MALIIRCTSCDDVLEDSTDRRQAAVLNELQDVGVVVVGDLSDPDEIVCASCVRGQDAATG